MEKSKIITLSLISSIGILGLAFGVVFSEQILSVNDALLFSSASSKTGNAYSFTLNSSNSPTTSSVFTSATGSVEAGDDNYGLYFNYSSVKALSDAHGVLENGSSIIREGDEYTRGVNSISANYSGGKLFVKYGLSDALHYREIPSDGTKLQLNSSYTFNKFEIYVDDGDVTLTDMTVDYDCADTGATNIDVNQGSIIAGDGAIVSGLSSLRDTYKYGEEQIFHVKAKGNGNITSVKVNGYDLQEDERLNNYKVDSGKYYSFYPGPDDVIEITTDVDDEAVVKVNKYIIDSATGEATLDSFENITTTYNASESEWYSTLTAPSMSGYVPNQDYVKFEKGNEPSEYNIYYSELVSSYSGSPSSSLSGTGTESDPYLITSIEDWMYFSTKTSNSNEFYKLTKSLDFNSISKNTQIMVGTYTGSISNNSASITLDSSKGNLFNGNFDGSYCSIRGMTINKAATDYYSGTTARSLFAAVGATGTLNNLSVYGNITANSNYVRTGGIAAFCQGSIYNCNSYVTVQRTGSANGAVGGLVGELIASDNDIYINNVSSYLSVSNAVTAGTDATTTNHVGGIVGLCQNDSGYTYHFENVNNFGDVTNVASNASGAIGSCRNISAGLVSISNFNNFGDITGNKKGIVAGIIAHSGHTTISNSNNFGTITGESNNSTTIYNSIAGIVAYHHYSSELPLSHVSNYGDIVLKASTVNSTHIGGILGVTSDSSNEGLSASYCMNYGNIQYLKENDSDVDTKYFGGITSWADKRTTQQILHCANMGDITVNCTNSFDAYVAGALGYVRNQSIIRYSIEYFINVGNITTGMNGYSIGGILGYSNNNSPVVAVSDSVNTGRIDGKANVAGLGANCGGANTSFTDCVNYGPVYTPSGVSY